MSSASVKLQPSDRLQEGDFVFTAGTWFVVKKSDPLCGMLVGNTYNCRRPVASSDPVEFRVGETEVEKLAREIYVRHGTFSAKDSFQYAEEFIAERDRRRKESGK